MFEYFDVLWTRLIRAGSMVGCIQNSASGSIDSEMVKIPMARRLLLGMILERLPRRVATQQFKGKYQHERF